MSSRWPIRLGRPLKNQTWLTADAREIRIASKSLVRAPRSWNEGLIYLHLLQYRLRSRFYDFLLRLDQFHVQAQRLELADQHVERFGQAGGERRVAFDDRFVNLRAAGDVVRLRRQQFLEN